MPSAADQLRAKSPDELRQELTGLRREHFNLRVQKAVQQLNKPSELRRVRREIARALTILREKEVSEFVRTGKALEFSAIEPEPKQASSEADVSPEIAAAAAASSSAEDATGGGVVKTAAAEADEKADAPEQGEEEAKAKAEAAEEGKEEAEGEKNKDAADESGGEGSKSEQERA